MHRLYTQVAATLFGALVLVSLSAGTLHAQTVSSTRSSSVATESIRLILSSAELRQEERHQAWQEEELQDHTRVLELKARLGQSSSSSSAVQYFDDSELLLRQRTDNLRLLLGRLQTPDQTLQALISRTKPYPSFYQDLLQLIEKEKVLKNRLLLGPYRDVHWIVDSRAGLLAALPSSHRDTLMRWSPQTQKALGLELSTVEIMTRVHVHRLLHQLANLPQFISDIGGLSTVVTLAFYLSVILFAFIWLRRQVPTVLEKLRVYEYQYARTVKRIRQVDGLIAFINHFGVIGVNIAAVHALDAVLQSRFHYIEIKVVFAIAFWVVYYRLAHKIVEVFIFRVARRRFKIDFQKRKDIANSIFFFGRVIITGGLLLSVVSAVTNFGMLYHWLRNLVFISAVIAGLILLNRWRPSVIAMYLEKGPKGKLAALVEQAKDKPYGFFLVVVAFLYVAAHGFVVLVRDTILGFEQSRKALAYFFRKRLERHAEELGQWDDQINQLPESLIRSFTLDALDDKSLRVDRFEDLERFQESYQRWLDYKIKGAVLLVSPLGYGKTTWLHRAVETEGVEHLWLSLNRLNSPEPSLCAYFRGLYEFQGTNLQSLTNAILEGPRCVLVLDDIHCLLTRKIGGCVHLEDLMVLIESTGHHVFWLCSMDSLSWKYLRSAQPQRSWFRDVIELSSWSDDEISQLIMARAAASGVVHSFEDLMTEEADEKTDRRLAEIGQSYSRLIWDSSDGCPWVALHYWLRSLAPVSESQVRVRLFRRVDLTRLEKWPKEAMFLYAAIALHSHLSARELSSILRYSTEMCESFLNQGCEEGYLICDENGRYHFNVNWYRPIMRYLSQRHAVEDV